MIKKLKLLQLVMMCVIVTCMVGLSSYAQSSTAKKDVQSESIVHQKYQAELEKINKVEELILAQPLTDELADKLEDIKEKRTTLIQNIAQYNNECADKSENYKVKSVAHNQSATQNRSTLKAKSVDDQVDIYTRSLELNREYGEKGIPFKTAIKTVNGKQYIELVELPEQHGTIPTKKQ